MTTSNSQIIGVSGRDRSGKDTVAEMLIEAGYFGFSFGDFVREHARQRHADDPNPISVANLTETSNWLRSEGGADVILKEALKAYEAARQTNPDYKGVVLYSVRAPIEVDFILEKGGQLVWVETTNEVRLQRRLDNIRTGEASVSMEEMLAHEALQENPQPGIPVEVQMNLKYVQTHATKVIENNGNDLTAFQNAVKKALNL